MEALNPRQLQTISRRGGEGKPLSALFDHRDSLLLLPPPLLAPPYQHDEKRGKRKTQSSSAPSTTITQMRSLSPLPLQSLFGRRRRGVLWKRKRGAGVGVGGRSVVCRAGSHSAGRRWEGRGGGGGVYICSSSSLEKGWVREGGVDARKHPLLLSPFLGGRYFQPPSIPCY